jgi:hypothetical protein
MVLAFTRIMPKREKPVGDYQKMMELQVVIKTTRWYAHEKRICENVNERDAHLAQGRVYEYTASA